MVEQDYKPNSNKFKAEQKQTAEKRVEKVINGNAKTRKKSDGRKLMDMLVTEDISSVKSHVFMDIIVPAIKKAIDDVVSDGIHMILYGGKGRDRHRGPASRVSYSRYYDERTSQRDERNRERIRNGIDYDNIIFDSRGDAEAVLEAMDGVLEQYGMVRLADLYDLADISSNNYMANRYGWTDIHTAQAVRVRDGWMLKLPRALPLD